MSSYDILQRIVDQRRTRIASDRDRDTRLGIVEPQLQSPSRNAFLAGLAAKRGRAVIAEVKMGSPSLGSLVDSIEPLELAKAYRRAGAAALSVVVEPDFFHGSYELLAACHEISGLPAIAKDFIVDPVQLHWARRAGASAILLIASLYSERELSDYADQARSLGLVPLIETHGLGDLMKLDGRLWELVGVNNRDLRSFEVTLDNSLALASSLPSSALKVSESGIATRDDVETLRSVGFDAYLIGTSLIRADDTERLLASLTGSRE